MATPSGPGQARQATESHQPPPLAQGWHRVEPCSHFRWESSQEAGGQAVPTAWWSTPRHPSRSAKELANA